MNKLNIKTILYILIILVTSLSVTYMYISYKHIKESTLKALKATSINRAYEVTKKVASLNNKMAWEYDKYNTNMYEALEYAQDYFQKNGRNASVEKLKEKLDENKDNLIYHIYLVDSKCIIKTTTFKPDLNLDFHIIPAALKTIKRAFQNPNFISLSSTHNDVVTNTYKKYILQKAKNQNYLIQISITIKGKENIKNLLKQVSEDNPNLLNTELYLLFLNEMKNLNIDTLYNNNYKEGSKNNAIVKNLLLQNFNSTLDKDKKIDKNNFKQYINKFVEGSKYKDFYFHRDGKYIHKVIMPFKSYKNYQKNTILIISMELDETEAEQTIQNINNIAYLISFLVIILVILSIVIIKTRIIKPIDNLQRKMRAKESVDTSKLLNKNDEINSMALVYNQLLKDLNREIITNEELLEEFKNFTANTIHQVRTPVSVIKIALEMIETTNKDAVLQIKASLISIEHMYDSLSYALHSEHINFTKQKLNFSELVTQRVELFSTIAKAYDIEIKSSIDRNLYVNMNQIEAEYLIDNNLSNAIKYGSSRKEISINLHKVASDISLSFESYGDAIEDTKIIFERYHRVNKDKKGNGIGLHMVNTICKNNNIIIRVDYIDGKNRFYYFLMGM